MTREEAVALLERYSNYDGMGIPNLAGCKEAMKVAVESLKEAFPELRENEDERIRAVILKLVLGMRDEIFTTADKLVTKPKVLAWLEKQKEPENVSATTMAPSCWAEEPSLQKEQKEIPLMNGDADMYFDEWNQQNQNPTKRQCFEEGIRYAQRLQKEQKPTWSEEDETRRKCCILYLAKVRDCIEFNQHIGDSARELGTKEIQKDIDWLKSLRPPQDRCKDCPHRGDMFLLTQGVKSGKHELAIKFMNYLDENRPEDKMSLSNGECEDIVKAFEGNDWAKIIRYVDKYRHHWRPSEEQMEALAMAVTFFKTEWTGAKVKEQLALESLCENLKKLI